MVKKDRPPSTRRVMSREKAMPTSPHPRDQASKSSRQLPVGKTNCRQLPVGETSSRQLPIGQTSCRQLPVVQLPGGKTSTRQLPVGQTSRRQLPVGQNTSSKNLVIAAQLPPPERTFTTKTMSKKELLDLNEARQKRKSAYSQSKNNLLAETQTRSPVVLGAPKAKDRSTKGGAETSGANYADFFCKL